MGIYTDGITNTGSESGGPTVSVGASGTAGTLEVYPATAAKGKTTVTAADNSGNTTTNINTAAQSGARTYTVPDMGGNASMLMTRQTLGASGLVPTQIPLVNFRNADGTGLAASAAAGKFGLSYTPGTAQFLLTEAANSNTKTDEAAIDIVLPPNYVNGQNITLTAHCNYTLGSGTVGTHTLAAAAYSNAADGTQGANLIATAAQTVPAADGAVTFTITGTGLAAGSHLTLTLTLVIQDTGASNITAQVNSLTMT